MSVWQSFSSWMQTATGELATAGLAGAAVSAAMEWSGFLPAVRKIIVGTLCALYLSPLAIPLLSLVLGGLNVPPEKTAGMSGFLMGVLGIVVIEILLKVFRLHGIYRAGPLHGGKRDEEA